MQLTTKIPSFAFYDYRDYVIGAWARPELTKGSTSIGVVYKRDKFGSMIQVRESRATSSQAKSRPSTTGWSCPFTLA
jgi:hypothetical protein